MAIQSTDPHYDRREGDPVYHQRPPDDSGTANSFATRHNEFPPTVGHESAAHDPRTGQPVHADGTPNEELPEQWRSARPAPDEVEP
ncbi:hypothetical protein [Agrococcus carbonis]|uniref:Uncharacterized protein n=1 Tax=Agrococcus carbonis TaxID=684552 RepID=A0A1H1LQD1_9MICO|nr:hypothetical protein [Agrococcus carbonis]SDR76550.1 hypothetical protein SAMN04489719_0701 [Agrococcus carbonis]